jgi:hypothetical protein
MNLNDPGVLESALSHDLMTRAGILSRVAELYDPCGWWEPIKVQMKLSLQFLNGLDWADPVPPDQRQEWIRLFDTMTQLKAIHIQRSVVPDKSPPAATFRIIAVADAPLSLAAHDDDQDTDITDVQPVPTYESMLYAKEIWFWVKFKFKEPGWERAVNYLRLVLKACTIIKHARHGSPDSTCGKCYLCQRSTSYLLVEVNHITDWMASRHLVSTFPQKRLADKFHKIQGVWYSKSRLEKEGLIDTQDIDYSPFFGHVHIKKMLPVLPVASPIFESYLHYIHTKELPHVGVEATLKRIKERFYPVGNARAAITNFKRQCSKCRLILKETVELELAQFPWSER